MQGVGHESHRLVVDCVQHLMNNFRMAAALFLQLHGLNHQLLPVLLEPRVASLHRLDIFNTFE